MRGRVAVMAATALSAASLMGPVPAAASAGTGPPAVFPTLTPNLVAHYDFDHPVDGDPARETDLGPSGTPLELINGGERMRVADGVSGEHALQLQQVSPEEKGNDDWKAGVYDESGVPSLRAFNGARETTVMGWFKMTGTNPSPNSNSEDPDDFYGAIGLAGVLTGDSDGHKVRALLEIFEVDGEIRLVALGRRIDGGDSQTFAASEPWETLLPQGEWVSLAATFNYDTGEMALYRNGKPLSGFYATEGDPWQLEGPPEPDLTTDTDPRGIKIGGSFPQNDRENNPCNCRMDDLMFLDRALTPTEIWLQYHWRRR